MKNVSFYLFLFLCFSAKAQITITASDMPVAGDTLRHSFADPGFNLNLSNTGAGIAWDFSALTEIAQAIDTYRTAGQVNPTYLLTISPTAYGYKLADSIPGASAASLSVEDVYTFFNKKNNPSRFVAEAFAAKVSGIPTPINYSDEDEWYFFPLNYGNDDSSTYKLEFSLPPFGSFSQSGYRKTTVDGWGTIVTPYFTTATPCLRVRSEIHEIDSVSFGSVSFGFPRDMVEYRWLVNGEHYPALWVMANLAGSTETVFTIMYRDHFRQQQTSIEQIKTAFRILDVYPNPAQEELHISLPDSWNSFHISVFDVHGKLVISKENEAVLNVSPLPAGDYFVRVMNGNKTGFARFTR